MEPERQSHSAGGSDLPVATLPPLSPRMGSGVYRHPADHRDCGVCRYLMPQRAAVRCINRNNNRGGNNNNSFSTKDLIKLSISLILLLLLTEFIGFHGHVQQSSDFIVRNPIYSTLIREDWPIYSRTGDYFVYYHAFWLPPALLCRWMHLQQHADTVLFCWTYLGLALTALTFFLRLKGKILLFTIILILAGSITAPVDAYFRWFTASTLRDIVFHWGGDQYCRADVLLGSDDLHIQSCHNGGTSVCVGTA